MTVKILLQTTRDREPPDAPDPVLSTLEATTGVRHHVALSVE